MKLYETESLSEKQRDKLTSYFKLKKKLKEFQNGCTPLVMIALFGEKRGDRLWVSFAGKCDRNADMCLLTCAQNKKYLGTNSEIRKSLQGIKEYGDINRQHYV
jgi:hypothetical protein